jgi:four helix bundle protein
MGRTNFENLRVYQLSEKLADEIWSTVRGWDHFAKQTIGRQLVRSSDSIGANLAEGTGRGTYSDNRRFVLIARGSLYEAQHWLRRAYMRNLLTSEQVESLRTKLDNLAPMLNSYLKSIGDTIRKERLERDGSSAP